MRLFRLRFISPLVENEYKRIRDLNMKSFFKLLIYILIISTILSIVQNIRIGSIDGFLRVSAILIVCIVLLRYGHRIERYIDYILAMLCLGLHLNGIVSTGDNISSRTQVTSLYAMACLNSGYTYAIFERLVILELTRLELKVAFSTASLIARLIVWPPASTFSYCYQVFFWILCLFVDIRRERNDRALFKSFYDFREEIIKFKNLMVSGLPTNILIVSKDIKKKLFLNDYFQTTFNIEPHDELWTPKEWLSSHHVEKDAIHIEGIQDQIRESVNLEEFLDILNTKGLLVPQNQNVSFITKMMMPETGDNKVFEAKVLSLVWDCQDAIMIIMNDVTQQYMNLTLKIADANKDKMIAMVSHELRNPLNGILGMIYIMEKRIEDSEVLKYLSVCKNSGKLLLNLVNSILDLGQIRSNKLKLVLSKGNLTQLLQETFLLFEFQFKQKNLYFKVEMEENVPEFVVTDLNRLRQILINLISNALKFTFDGGVSLHVRKDTENEENIIFEVTDTGIGIKEEEKRKLFKMYGRLDQSDRKINIEGVGLGLTISDHLVRLLACNKQEGENIMVRSEYGKGTTLSFSIKVNLEGHNITERELYINDDSVCEEGNNDMYRRVSTYVLHSQGGLNTDKCLSRLELEVTPKRSHSTYYEREDKVFYKLTSLTDNEDEILLKKPKSKGLVLLVDDNPFNIMVAKNLIEGLGYKVQTALNGKIAVDLVKKVSVSGNSFNIVFMDCQMPVMDGFEATVEIRRMIEDKEVSNVPIVALSANDSDDDKKRCKDVGMNDHLAKPVSESKLKGVLDKYCRQSPYF